MPTNSQTEDIANDPHLPKRTILLADDDPQVRELLASVLDEHGFRVIKASDGFEACGLFMDAPDQVDLLVSDVLMPKMNGVEAYRIMRRIKPDLPVILISGYADGIDMSHKDGGVIPEIMAKPLRTDHLISRIHELLGDH
jgi:two-component system, cell cycle sensor histidine kinase and response regulator CckA